MLVKSDRERDLDYLRQSVETLRRDLIRHKAIHARVSDVALNEYDRVMVQTAEEAIEAWEAQERQRERLHSAVATLATFVGNGYVPTETVALLREAIQREDAKQEGGKSM
jgi:MoxR-like ATPase